MKNRDTEMPNILPNGRGSFSKSGAAPEPGGTRYVNMAAGTYTTVYESLTTNTGGWFSWVAVRGNGVFNRVKVPHEVIFGGGKIGVGDSLLIGGIKMTGEAPEATMAWRFGASGNNRYHAGKPLNPHPFSPRPPRLARNVGTVSRVHPTGKFAEILEDRSGQRYFAHQSQFENAARMLPGFRVSFTAAKTERGLAALDIKPN